jgi:hypothetical protein
VLNCLNTLSAMKKPRQFFYSVINCIIVLNFYPGDRDVLSDVPVKKSSSFYAHKKEIV